MLTVSTSTVVYWGWGVGGHIKNLLR